MLTRRRAAPRRRAADSRRPSLPPLLLLGLGTWGGTAAAYSLAAPAPSQVLAGAALGSLALVAVCALAWAHQGKATAAALFLGLSLGIACGLAGALGAKATEVTEPQWGEWRLVLLEDVRASDRGHRALARASGDAGRQVTVSLSIPEGASCLMAGDAITTRAMLRPVGEDADGSCWRRGIRGRLTASSWDSQPASGPLAPLRALRRTAVEGLARHGGDQAALMQALACGFRAPLDETGGYAPYQACGLAHLVAVSGAHLSLVSAGLSLALRALRASPRARALATLATLGAFLVFAGMPVSAVRAALMAASSAGALLARRRPAALSALGACLVVFPALDPPTALSASFALSAGSTLGIIVFSRLFASWLGFLPPPAQRAVGEPLALTLASAVVTQPYAAALFARLSLMAPLANVIAAPLFTAACLASLVSAAAASLAPGAAPLIIGIGAQLAAPLGQAAGLLAVLPHASVPIDAHPLPAVALSAALAALLYWTWPRPRPAALALATALTALVTAFALLVAPLLAPTQLVMLDVGQGDALLVRSRGAAILVDTGNRDNLLLRGLARQGVCRLDAVAITHADDDHCASLGALAGAVPVGRVIIAADALTCPCGPCARLRAAATRLVGEEDVVGVEAGDGLTCGDIDLAVVWPRSFSDAGGNADSLCLLATAAAREGHWSALLTGDAEAAELSALAPAAAPDGVDVLKVGHHGSAASVDEDVARALSPAVALVSVGENNRYGHPSPTALAALEDAGAAVFRTDRHGDVAVTFGSDALRIDVQRPRDSESRVE